MERGRRECLELDQLVKHKAEEIMTSVLRKRILRHLRECDVCQANRRRFASPAEIFGALTPVTAPIGLKEETFSNLLAQWGADPPR